MARKDDAIVLTPGSLYRVKSLESREKPLETVGVFKGYAAIAHDTAVVMEVELSIGESKEQLTRLIPAHMIISIDVLKAEKEEEQKEKDTNAVYFG
jgi:flagellar motor switch protein FliM